MNFTFLHGLAFEKLDYAGQISAHIRRAVKDVHVLSLVEIGDVQLDDIAALGAVVTDTDAEVIVEAELITARIVAKDCDVWRKACAVAGVDEDLVGR